MRPDCVSSCSQLDAQGFLNSFLTSFCVVPDLLRAQVREARLW